MASSYILGNKTETYVVRVSDTGRGKRTIENREFADYHKALHFCNAMEAKYGSKYIVDFDTKFK